VNAIISALIVMLAIAKQRQDDAKCGDAVIGLGVLEPL
jgi:hypothetical protein